MEFIRKYKGLLVHLGLCFWIYTYRALSDQFTLWYQQKLIPGQINSLAVIRKKLFFKNKAGHYSFQKTSHIENCYTPAVKQKGNKISKKVFKNILNSCFNFSYNDVNHWGWDLGSQIFFFNNISMISKTHCFIIQNKGWITNKQWSCSL